MTGGKHLGFTYLGSFCLLIVIFVQTTIAGSSGNVSVKLEKKDDLVLISNNDGPLNEEEIEDEGNSILLSQDDINQGASNKFSWRHHQDDHSIYAHRSLMSAASVRNPAQEALEANLDGDHNSDRKNNNKMTSTDADEDDPLKTSDFVEKEWQLMFRSFDLAYDSVSSSLLQQIGKQTNLFEDIVSRLKADCQREIYHVRDSVNKHKLWALRMLDSNGKIPSGVTYGRFSSPGDYEECLSVNVDELIYKPTSGPKSALNTASGTEMQPEHHKFHGKYCLLDFRLPMPERPPNKLLSIHDPVLDLSKTDLAKEFPMVLNYSGYASVFYEIGYMHAFCLPSVCEVTDLTKSMGQVLEGLHIIVNNTVDCEEKPTEPVPFRTSQVISLILMALLFTNATFASIVHYMQPKYKERNYKRNQSHQNQHQDKSKSDKNVGQHSESGSWLTNFKKWVARSSFYPECFSIQTNFGRLTKPDPRGLTFVHYTRIVAMGLTVITHTAGLGTLQAITKPADASNSEQIFRDLIPQMLANAFSSIQIFFFMAGFMLVISTYPSIRREKGHMSFLEYAIKRAIRLMPGIVATICLNFLWPLIVDGPMLTYFIRMIVVPCESNWWRTMAFLSNFDHVERMCLRHSYFSASDYQLHIMAFPLLIILYKQPTISLFIAGILTVAGFAAQVIMILTKTVLPFMMVDYLDKEAFFNVVHYIHHPVWNHMSAFFYGFIIGYLVVRQIRIDISDKTIKRIWYVVLPLGIASIFAPYFWNHYKRPIYRWQMVLYVIFDRFILLTTCAWLSYATMVLGRKPAPRKNVEQVGRPNLNLPSIVTLEHDKLQGLESGQKQPLALTSSSSSIMVHQSRGNNEDSTQTNMDVQEMNHQTGQLLGSPGSIPRQRSTPNLQSLGVIEGSDNNSANQQQQQLRSSLSNRNIASSAIASEVQASEPGGAIPLESISRQPADSNVGRQEGQKKRTQAPVSNVNTLCLVLSRLTFQLYLFNMVVLWVDVNNSKYSWFFSYYFIITKALAVYICSSIMAMIFFITMESPCLTLYIMWVKSRAKSRASENKFNL